ncbi:MAG: glycosyltransferase family 39 protein, partial [Planctomycetaceae bacterium]|nr:glycosyltransferase family 39 protein [Planctomycetaceae bacterium]
MKDRHRRRLLTLLAIALVLRLAAAWAWQAKLPGHFGLGDSESYWQLGRAIAEGRPYEYGPEHARVFRTPGYPMLLAPVIWLAGDGSNGIMLARAEAALFGTLAVLGVWWLALLLFGDRVAWIAAILATFYPGAIALSVLVLSEAPFCPLMLLQLGLWVCASRAARRWQAVGWGLGAGLAAGAATLMRPSWLLFTPLAAAVVVLLPQNRHHLPGFGTVAWGPGTDRPPATICHRIGVACWMMLGLVIVLMPWWIRTACVTGRVVPTTLQVGASLYDGLNP